LPTVINVGVIGAAGRMGQAVCHAVAADPDLDLVAAVDRSRAGDDLDTVVGLDGSELVVAEDVADLTAAGTDVVVDFTVVEAARVNLAAVAAGGIHAVVGTTGFTDDDLEMLRSSFDSSNCLVAPNFAVGAVLMMRFAELAAPLFETAEVIELHHDGKIDAPSGTAMRTVERMAAASSDWGDDPTDNEMVAGARGGMGPGGIRVHSVRLRGLVAHQEVLFGTTGQTLTIRHDSTDRTSFMPGVLAAVKRIEDLPGLTIGLESVLGI
jgi:4-hydroxy-tetrahydrodipicolinate reductase